MHVSAEEQPYSTQFTKETNSWPIYSHGMERTQIRLYTRTVTKPTRNRMGLIETYSVIYMKPECHAHHLGNGYSRTKPLRVRTSKTEEDYHEISSRNTLSSVVAGVVTGVARGGPRGLVAENEVSVKKI